MKRHVTRIARQLSPKRALKRRNDRRVIQMFGDEFGLVYFGHVSSQTDEYRMVRGLTLSTKHHDLHYCIGTYEGYDVVFVERSDQLLHPTKRVKQSHRWHIMEIDLKTTADLPHIFVGLHTHSESFYTQLFTKYPELRALHLGNLGPHQPDFLAKYRVYGPPAQILEIERLLSPLITDMIAKHFGALAIEIHESSLFVYSEQTRLSRPLLEGMLKNGVWLARHIDTVSSESQQPLV